MKLSICGFALGLALAGLATTGGAATLGPDPAQDIGLMVNVTAVATLGTKSSLNNYASPVLIGDHLYIMNQAKHSVSILDADGTLRPVLSDANLPPGLAPVGANGYLNMAGGSGRTYVRFTSSTLPDGFGAVHALPGDAAYGTARQYDLVYSYDQAADGTLSNPKPLSAFETSTISGVHRGDGMLVLPDGRLLMARGDNLGADYYGLTAPQEVTSSAGKLLIINGDTGVVQVAAEGVRNVQHLTYTDASQTKIAFADIGWRAAEEINTLDVSALQDTSKVENFGWGINADGKAREGDFYVGYDGLGTTEHNAAILGKAPFGEDGFIQPYAQFGRLGTDYTDFFAASGPVTSAFFSQIGMLFADLVKGDLFATLKSAAGDLLNTVYRVWVAGADGKPVSMPDYLGLGLTGRADLRFFSFADGSAGFISEDNGTMYRISEVPSVPVPGGLGLLGLGLGALALLRRRRA